MTGIVALVAMDAEVVAYMVAVMTKRKIKFEWPRNSTGSLPL